MSNKKLPPYEFPAQQLSNADMMTGLSKTSHCVDKSPRKRTSSIKGFRCKRHATDEHFQIFFGIIWLYEIQVRNLPQLVQFFLGRFSFFWMDWWGKLRTGHGWTAEQAPPFNLEPQTSQKFHQTTLGASAILFLKRYQWKIVEIRNYRKTSCLHFLKIEGPLQRPKHKKLSVWNWDSCPLEDHRNLCNFLWAGKMGTRLNAHFMSRTAYKTSRLDQTYHRIDKVERKRQKFNVTAQWTTWWLTAIHDRPKLICTFFWYGTNSVNSSGFFVNIGKFTLRERIAKKSIQNGFCFWLQSAPVIGAVRRAYVAWIF